MRKSEILENYIKLAQEQNLPKVEDTTRLTMGELTEAQKKERAKKLLSLYNLEKELNGEKYDFNIVEIAHPEPAVVMQSYDKVNGLVENVNERSSIMQDIAKRTPTGQGMPKKYAQELTLALVRVANELDNSNHQDLMRLADVCLLQANHQFKKKAIAPIAIAAWTAAATVLGGIYAKQHLAFFSDGFEKDHEKLIKEIEDVLSANSNWGFGKDYHEDFLKSMRSLEKDLSDFYAIYKQVKPVIESLNKPRNAKELMEVAKSSKGNEVKEAYKALEMGANNILPKLDFVKKNFTNNAYKNMQIKEKGFFDGVAEKAMLLGGKGFVADDMDDISHAVEAYMGDITELAKILRGADEYSENAKRQLEQSAQQAAEQQNSSEQNTTPNQTPRSVDELDEEAKMLDNMQLS